MTTRLLLLTRKVPTQFCPIYCHIDYDANGRIDKIDISSPGRYFDSTVDDAFRAIAGNLTGMVKEIQEGKT